LLPAVCNWEFECAVKCGPDSETGFAVSGGGDVRPASTEVDHGEVDPVGVDQAKVELEEVNAAEVDCA
jgi:hypothetical protein